MIVRKLRDWVPVCMCVRACMCEREAVNVVFILNIFIVS